MIVGKLYRNKSGKGMSGPVVIPAGVDLTIRSGSSIRWGGHWDKDSQGRDVWCLTIFELRQTDETPQGNAQDNNADGDMPF